MLASFALVEMQTETKESERHLQERSGVGHLAEERRFASLQVEPCPCLVGMEHAMRRLILLRHAKALHSSGGSDHERPLTSAGVKTARLAGQSIAAAGWRPDLAVVSDAMRTTQTFEELRPFLSPDLVVRVEPGLYEATPEGVMAIVREVSDDLSCVLVVGHNPGIGEAARRSAVDGPPEDLARLRSRFPTAAFATLTFDVDSWRDIGPQGRLEACIWVDSSAAE